MRIARKCWIATVAVVTAACAANPSPVHVAGAPGELAMLTGKWVGEYVSVETGRSGSISFTLRAGTDTATGDVVMIPRPLPPTTSDVPKPVGVVPPTPRLLPISFVRVSARVVSGTLAPYPSPDCGCTLSTVFRGTLGADRIEGTFVTSHSDHMAPQQKGTWWVARKSTSPH